MHFDDCHRCNGPGAPGAKLGAGPGDESAGTFMKLVAGGVLVWFLTKVLDRKVFGKGR